MSRPTTPFRLSVCLVVSLLTLGGRATPSGAADPPADTAAVETSFKERVQPILAKHCLACHNPQKFQAKLDLSTLDTLLKGSAAGPVIEPGQAAESLLFQLIQEDGIPHMPPKQQLAKAEIEVIGRWINSLPKSLARTGGLVITEEHRNHWAFRPVVRPTPPAVTRPDWVRTPIDAFILAHLDKQGLTPNPPADKLDLIRRATFDLTGLPPTPDEVHAFLADDSPDAWEKVVDRLLASPHYGERWGRHWLDLARYADSDGFEFDVDRPHAFRYRDYVIRSFNADKPYDRFILEQLAGDEIDPTNPDALTATGFCRNGPTIDNQVNEKNRLDELDDIIATTGTVFLGLTIGCARCHDHKYDPIRQQDYYQMLAIFTSREKRDLQVGTPEEMERFREQLARHEAAVSALRRQIAELTPAAAPTAGKWRVAGAELVQESADADVRLVFGNADWTDSIIELEVKATGGTEGVLVGFRAADERNGYWVHLGAAGNTEHRVLVAVNGKSAAAGPAKPGSLAADRWHRVRLSVIGTQFKVFLDDELILEFADARHPRGRVGLGCHRTTARFRNLRVRELDGQQLFAGVPKLGDAQALAEDERQAREREKARLEQQLRQLEGRRPRPPVALGIQDAGPIPRPTFFLHRGDHRTPGPEVQPGVPLVLAREPLAFPPAPPGAQSTGRRSVLARWIASPDNPLTARVLVNRIWQYHFERGLVETSSNFGFNGSPPSHPELLDWLAAEFLAQGWRLKPMHKLIMTSAVYMQSSAYDADKARIDGNNLTLWRYPMRRLEAEAIRDAILAASGNLNRTMYGPGIKPRIHPSLIATGSTMKWPLVEREGPEHWRRSVYVFVKRSVLLPMLEGFDAPTATQSCERRLTTTVATQALQLMNNAFANEQAADMARRVRREVGPDLAQQVERVYWLALARPPTAEQRALAVAFLRDQQALHRGRPDPALAALTDLCHVMFNLNEFVYVR
jgi:hypothetical protein